MQCWLLFCGGRDFPLPNPMSRAEVVAYPSVDEARRGFAEKVAATPDVVMAPPEQGGPVGWLCLTDPYRNPDLTAEKLLRLGPRGGVIVVAADRGR